MDIQIEEPLVEVLHLNQLLGLLVTPYNYFLVEISFSVVFLSHSLSVM